MNSLSHRSIDFTLENRLCSHMGDLPEIMGTGDVMEYLGVSKQRVYELIERGQLKPRRTSAGIIFLKSDIAAYKRKRDLWKSKRQQRSEG